MIRKRVLKKIITIFLILITIVGLILGLTLVFFKMKEKSQETQVEKYKEICYGNKYIGKLSLEGMKKEQILYILDNEISEIKNRVVKVKINDQEFVNTISTFSPQISILLNGKVTKLSSNEEIAEYIIQLDKDLSVMEQLNIIDNSNLATKVEIAFDYKIDGEIVEEYVTDLANRFYVAKVEGTMKLTGGGVFEVTDSVDEQKLNEKHLIKAIKKKSNKKDWKSVIQIEGKVDVSSAHFNSNELKQINTLISSFQTSFVASSSRGSNIILGSSRINGTVLMPGDKFSVDATILPRTSENGYLVGKAFLDGRTVDSVGGGVCQIATTLYNTILQVGIIPEVRKPHSMPVSYVPLGLDAAVTTGIKDLVFTNTLSVPIYIEATNKGNTLIYNIYSKENALEGYTYKPRSVQHSSLSATTYLDVYKDGTLVKSIYLHKDRYEQKKG